MNHNFSSLKLRIYKTTFLWNLLKINFWRENIYKQKINKDSE